MKAEKIITKIRELSIEDRKKVIKEANKNLLRLKRDDINLSIRNLIESFNDISMENKCLDKYNEIVNDTLSKQKTNLEKLDEFGKTMRDYIENIYPKLENNKYDNYIYDKLKLENNKLKRQLEAQEEKNKALECDRINSTLELQLKYANNRIDTLNEVITDLEKILYIEQTKKWWRR